MTADILVIDPSSIVGEIPNEQGSSKAETRQIASTVAANGKAVLYFHGGLVKQEAGTASAQMLLDTHLADININKVGLVWRTGLLDAIVEIFREEIESGRLLEAVYRKAVAFLARKAAGVVFGDVRNNDLPFSPDLYGNSDDEQFDSGGKGELNDQLVKDFADQLEKDLKLSEKLETISTNDLAGEIDVYLRNSGYSETDEQSQFCGEEEVEQKFVGRKAITYFALALAETLVRIAKGTDHGFHATLVESLIRKIIPVAELGRKVWGGMKSQAKDMWKPSDNDVDYAGRYFLDQLVSHLDDVQTLELDLIGHSAGSICIAELLAVLKESPYKQKIRVRNIFFMAPAIAMSDFASVFMNGSTQCENLRIFNLSDDAERRDELINLPMLEHLYPSSLLYFVSGVLENESSADTPLLGMERYFSGERPYQHGICAEVRQFFDENHSIEYHVATKASEHGGENGPMHDDIVLKKLISVLAGA